MLDKAFQHSYYNEMVSLLRGLFGEALRQIEEKKYAFGLQRQGMKKIIRYGIAFWKKECMVVIETNETEWNPIISRQ